MEFETKAIHVGQAPDTATGALTTPIYQTSTFAQEAVGVNKGYDYARVANPTRTALQECLASLEGAAHGHAFSSGLGAATTLMHLLSPGDHVVSVNDVYGGIYRMFSQVYEPKGYRFTYLTPEQISTGLAEHVDEQTKLVWLESPTNPLLNIVDIEAASAAAHAVGALVVVDNTFATPYLQQPLALGADIALHSTTKYLGGHSDVVGGFIATNDSEVSERLAFLQRSSARFQGRSTAGSCSEASRHSRCGCTVTARTQPRSRLSSSGTRGSSAFSTPACPRTRVTRSPRARCAASEG